MPNYRSEPLLEAFETGSLAVASAFSPGPTLFGRRNGSWHVGVRTEAPIRLSSSKVTSPVGIVCFAVG